MKQEFWSINSDPMYDNGKPYIIWGPNGPGHGIIAHIKPWCVVTSQEEHEELVKRAQLIAAAPEMLEALKRIASDGGWREYCKQVSDDSEQITHLDACHIVQVRNVIAKAEGGSRDF